MNEAWKIVREIVATPQFWEIVFALAAVMAPKLTKNWLTAKDSATIVEVLKSVVVPLDGAKVPETTLHRETTLTKAQADVVTRAVVSVATGASTSETLAKGVTAVLDNGAVKIIASRLVKIAAARMKAKL